MLASYKTLFFTAILSATMAAPPVLACYDKPLFDEAEKAKLEKRIANFHATNTAAFKLGVEPHALFYALKEAGGQYADGWRHADLAQVANQLGVSQVVLKEALLLPSPPSQ